MTEARWLRVLVISRNLPPLVGGMENLVQQMIVGLHQWADVSVVGPTGCSDHLPVGVAVREIALRPLSGFLWGALRAGVAIALRFRPDIVIAGSGLTAPIALIVARSCRARSVVYVHGLDIVTKHTVYQRLWLPLIRRCDLVLANSDNTRRLAIQHAIPAERVRVVNPGADVPMFDPAARRRFRERFDLGEQSVLLSVGRLTVRKGLTAFVLQSLPAILKARPDSTLVVIGGDAIDALHRNGSVGGSSELLAAALEIGATDRVRLIGPCDASTLRDAYFSADLHVFPVREVEGDVEGFGMVAVEAAAHGLPTVAFQVGGVADAVVRGRTGDLVEPGNYSAFATEALLWLGKVESGEVRRQCRTTASKFGWSHFHERVRSLLRSTWES